MNFAPGSNFIRILPPKNMRWDYPFLRFVSKETADKMSSRHNPELWKSCPMCVRDAVAGVVAFIQWVNECAPQDSNLRPFP